MKFTARLVAHWDMLDLMGIVHNSAYPLFFERARTQFWRELGYAEYGDHSFDWPYMVVHNEVDYRAPIQHEEEISVTVWVKSIGRTSMMIAHEVFRADGVLSADGNTVFVRIDPETKRPIPWSESLKQRLQPYIE